MPSDVDERDDPLSAPAIRAENNQEFKNSLKKMDSMGLYLQGAV